MPNDTILSDGQIAEIEARQERAEAKYMAVVQGKQWWRETGTPTSCIGESLEDIPALCQTVRVLREELTSVSHKLSYRDAALKFVKEKITALREQLAQAQRRILELETDIDIKRGYL